MSIKTYTAQFFEKKSDRLFKEVTESKKFSSKRKSARKLFILENSTIYMDESFYRIGHIPTIPSLYMKIQSVY